MPENATNASESASTDETFIAVLPSEGLKCIVCSHVLDHHLAQIVVTDHLVGTVGCGVAVCPVCIDSALRRDHTTDRLFAAIRLGRIEEYRPNTPAPRPRKKLTLRRRAVNNARRRHPAYHRALLENPPPADEGLQIALDWKTAMLLPEPRLVVRPEDNIARLRFDVAKGRRVRVVHSNADAPDRLMRIAQALIDYGANQVELYLHPIAPGSGGSQILSFYPEAQ